MSESRYPVGTVVIDMHAFAPEDMRPKYELQEDGKWTEKHIDWLRYTITDNEIGAGKRYILTEESEAKIIDLEELPQELVDFAKRMIMQNVNTLSNPKSAIQISKAIVKECIEYSKNKIVI